MTKCYIFVCLACDALDIAERTDKITCSTACRVQAHRTGAIKRLRKQLDANHLRDISLGRVLRGKAIERLYPEIVPDLLSGTRGMDDDAVRSEMVMRFWRAVDSAIAGDRSELTSSGVRTG
jgi:hypothetical protein